MAAVLEASKKEAEASQAEGDAGIKTKPKPKPSSIFSFSAVFGAEFDKSDVGLAR